MKTTMIKKLYTIIALTLCFASQAVGQTSVFPDLSKVENVHDYSIVVPDETAMSYTFDLYNFVGDLRKDFDVNGDSFSKIKYVQCYIVGKTNDEIIAFTGGTTFSPNGTSGTMVSDDNAFFWYGNLGINLGQWWQTGGKITFNRGNGLNWNDIKYFVIVLTDDTDGLNVNDGAVTSIPETIKSAFRFDIQTQGFRHYKGYAYEGKDAEWDDVNDNQMQKTHEWTYDKFVKRGEKIELYLPFQNIPGSGQALEPRGYFRWYNYETDKKSGNLDITTHGNSLKEVHDADDAAINRGLFAWNLQYDANDNGTTNNVAGIDYVAPTDAGWAGEKIACDVSRYIDGLDVSGTYLMHEPTLSNRYIYNVYPAEEIANRLKDAVCDPTRRVYEDFGYVSIGIHDGNSTTNLRVNLQEVSDYYFYHYKHSNEKVTGNYGTEDDFESELYQAQAIEWRVYDASGDWYKNLQATTDKMYALSLNNLNTQESWKWIGNGAEPGTKPSDFKAGDIVYITAFVSNATGFGDNDKRCPLANFTCRFHGDSYPMKKDDPQMPTYRTIDYLEENYDKVAEISFDNMDENVTLAAPTSPSNNMVHIPHNWDNRFYGFVYYDLYDKMTTDSKNYSGLSPLHGEYGFYKSFNVSNVSISGGESQGYRHQWWYTTAPFYDRTYAKSGGSQYGYFLYVDASDETRQIAEAEFTGTLCEGSIIVISAAVANLTSASIDPQLMFKLYGIVKDAEGNITSRKLIHTFASGDFSTQKATEKGVWYQVYMRSSLQVDTDVDKFDRFLVTIDNYCPGTLGADYAIDDIQIFTRNSKIDVVQQSVPCGNPAMDGEFKIRMNYESLIAWMGAYTGWDLSTTTPGQKYLYWRIYNSDGTPYTSDDLYNSTDGWKSKDYGRVTIFRAFDNNKSTSPGTDGYCGRETASDGEQYIIIKDGVKLPADGEYYVSFAREESDDAWSSPDDKCSAYSYMFKMQSQTIKITDANGNVLSNFPLPCGEEEATLHFGATITIPDPLHGGTYTLSQNDLKQLDFTYTINRYDSKEAYDSGTPSKTFKVDDPSAFKYKKDDHLSYYGYLYIEISPIIISDDETITIYTKDDGTGTEVKLCLDPMEVALKETDDGPVLNLGFDDVTYDHSINRVVRLGLGQFNDMVKNTKNLILPVHSYESYYDNSEFNLTVDTNEPLVISDTNDPTCKKGSVATVSGLTYSLDTKQVEIAFSDVSMFHEGYWYEMNFLVHETNDGKTCDGDVFFTIKVVPEYVTWTGAAASKKSTNWNNDENWERSKKAYIYKGKDYSDYTTPLSHQKAFVPMKFTKVTIDPNIQATSLASLDKGGDGIINSGLHNSEYAATDDIEYDIMVKVTPNSDGHYECEKFYGNTCKEIYFKPAAELRYQQYLTYDKAWVEYELEPNKWYMLTSPLKDVYAGDMYVPTGLGATQGRQETEAFKDIKFSDTDVSDNSLYSRTKYPIYQRSWDKANSMVITPKNDSFGRTDYNAYIDYDWSSTDEIATMGKANWSHTYNDVTVPYTPNATGAQNGFSLRANKKDVKNNDVAVNALIRIPKADEQYYYYWYDSTEEPKSGETKEKVTKTGNPNLLVDNPNNQDVVMTLSNADNDNGLYLVSNPYMASLDMTKFFSVNSGLERKFWIVSAGTMYAVSLDGATSSDTTRDAETTRASTTPTIAPTQAFFVKKRSDSDISEVSFTTGMITATKVALTGELTTRSGKFTEQKAAIAATRAITLTASYEDKQSTAKVVVRDNADEGYAENEDVETFYDSNLADVPTLYTVAGDQAVSVNALPEVNVLPMGIVCSEDVDATLQLSRTASMTDDLYLFDIKTGASTLLSDSTSVTVATNEHGRYFLTNRAIEKVTEREESGIKCYSPAPGLLTVACLSAGDTIERIELYTVDGKKVQTIDRVDNTTTTLNTYKGIKIVVVKHTGNDQAETAKVAVR